MADTRQYRVSTSGHRGVVLIKNIVRSSRSRSRSEQPWTARILQRIFYSSKSWNELNVYIFRCKNKEETEIFYLLKDSGGGGGRGGQTFFKQKRPLRLFTAATTFFQPVDWDEMSRWDYWRERQRNPWPHTSCEAKKQQKKSHFWYLIRIDPVEHIKNFGRGQIHIFQTRTNLQVYKQNTVSQRWETQARGSPWIKLDWETPTWTWSKETRAWTFIIYLHLTKRRGSKLIRQKRNSH